MKTGRRYHGAKDIALDLGVTAAQGIWARRQTLAPVLAAAAAAPTAVIAHGLAQLPDATPYVSTGGGLTIAAGAAAAYALPDGLRGPGYATVAAIGGVGVWMAIDPWTLHPWGSMALAAVGCQAVWLVGKAMVSTDKTAKAKKRGDRLVEASRWDGHVSAVTHTKGHTEWRIALGINTRAASIKVADVAHVLGVTTDRVHVWAGATSREVTIRLMARRPSSKPQRHPALVKATAADWAPGLRSVVDPIPIGPSPAGLSDPVTMSPRPDGDVAHMLVAGMTGSGKSYSLAALLTGLMACHDVILAGADIPKAGQTLAPFRDAFAHVATDLDEMIADLQALERLSKQRIRRMNAMRDDKWDPPTHGPIVVYVLEEWAATISEAGDRKDELVELVDRLGATIRSAGIPLLICTQRPDGTSMGSTRIRSHIRSAMIHKVANRKDLMGILPGEDIDLSVLTRQGDSLIACGSGGIVRGRAWAVPPRDRYELAERYAERPGMHPDDVAILADAGWTVTAADEAAPATRSAAGGDDETPVWADEVLAGIADLPEADEDVEILGHVPTDAPADVVLYILVEALGDNDRITTDDAVAALGWAQEGDDEAARNAAKSRLSKAVSDATGGAVKPVLRRVPGSDTERARYYMRDDIAAAVAPPAAE